MASYADMKKLQLTDLPAELLVSIASLLDFKSLSRVGQTCKRLKEISNDDGVWRNQCEKEYLVTEKEDESKTWKKVFRWYHHRFGRYHCPSIYRTMRRLWNRLEKYLKDNDHQMLESLRDPCDISEILIGEERLKGRFPPDLRCSLQIHNGQQMQDNAGLHGCVSIASYFRSEGLLDCASMARRFDEIPSCVPVTCCPETGKCQYAAVNDSEGFIESQVFYPIMNPLNRICEFDIFITANSFEEWLEDLVSKLEQNKFPRINDNIHRFEHDPESMERSYGSFTVSVATCFLPEVSVVSPSHFLHIYRITMSMDADANPSLSCQLETRHWVITNMDGEEEFVDGDGVVGEFPTMTPGASFSWISCTTFSTTHGSMRGSFTMKNLHTGEAMEIMCPTFHMRCLPYQLDSDRRQSRLDRKKNL